MHRCFAKSTRRRLSLNQMLRSRFLYLVTCSFALSFLLTRLDYNPSTDTDNLVQEALKNVAKDSRYSEIYRKRSKLPRDIKYILLWTDYDYAPFYYFEEGQKSFIENNCSVINCYVTANKNFFKGDLTKFHAVAFNGRTMSVHDLPKTRSSHQKYIYVNMESADNEPVCKKQFDGYFNWTLTYKLDSDILFPYISIKNKQGMVVGPQIDMRWPQDFPNVDDNLSARLRNKTRAAAWFVSHCSSKSGRDRFVQDLKMALYLYGHVVDIYGSCGTLKCPRHQQNSCNFLLERDYFFYLALENSFAEDYVTEKVLTALQHDTVPIVFGGANYSKFLPPGSYIDSKKFDVYEIAAIMDQLMSTPEAYKQFFRWKSQYTYSDPVRRENLCAVCTAINDKKKLETITIYKEFRKWWNPNYKKTC